MIAKVKEHPIFDLLCDALAMLGCEWKDFEDDTETLTSTCMSSDTEGAE